MSHDETSGRGLDRRSMLKLLAGVPLVLGLPRLGWSQESARPEGVPEVAAWAAEQGRPLVLVQAPSDWDLRSRLGKRLHQLLEDGALRLVVRDAVWVVATADVIGSVAGAVTVCGGEASVSVVLPSEELPEAIAGDLVGDDAAAEAFCSGLREALWGPGDRRLRERAEAECAALGGEAPRLRAALARGTEVGRWCERAWSAVVWGAVQAGGAGWVDEVFAPEAVPEPVGTSWSQFTPGCGQEDPYAEGPRMACGMGHVEADPKRFLQIVAS